MHAEPFTQSDSRRVIEHPDTPAAYVEWVELLPLLAAQDRTFLGNQLGWSHRLARSPLGASRGVFEKMLRAQDDTVDRWLRALATTPVADFTDHHVPFLRNLGGMTAAGSGDAVVRSYLDLYQTPGTQALRRAPARKAARGYPESVILEITRSCNFACTMCSSRTDGFKPEFTMPLPVFGELVRVLGPHAKSLRLNGYGETTLVPDLGRYIDCLDEFDFRGLRELITNLSAPPDVYEELLARGFVLLVSWDTTSASTFEQIRVGARYTEMLTTLRRVGAAARQEPERLGLLATVQESTIAEVEGIVGLAAEVGAGLVIFNMVKEADGSPWMATRFEELRQRFAEAKRLGDVAGVTVRIPDHLGARRLPLHAVSRSSATSCDRPRRELLVRWDTELTTCNMFNPFSYGVLRPPGRELETVDRFDSLWNGPNAALFRRTINSRTPHPYCHECYFLYP